MSIKVKSASFEHGNELNVSVDGQQVNVPGERGIGLVIVEKGTRKVIYTRMFDTYLDPNESANLNAMLYQTRPGNLLIMGIKDNGSRSLTLDLIQTITSLGSKYIHELGDRDSWAFIARKGKPHSAKEVKDAHKAVELYVEKKSLRRLHATSASFEHGNFFKLKVNNGAEDAVNYSSESQRGIVMAIVNKEGKLVTNEIFDTFHSAAACDQLETAIQSHLSQSVGCLIVLGVKDEGSRSLTPSLRRLITSLGSQQINQLEYRESWAFIARIGKPQSAKEVREAQQAANLTWVPKRNRAHPPPQYTIHYNPPSMVKSQIEHSPDDLYHHPHPPVQPIIDQPVESVHYRRSGSPSGVGIGVNVKNKARRRDTIS